MFSPAPAKAVDLTPPPYTAIPLWSNTVQSAVSITNTAATPIDIPPNTIACLQASTVCANAGTSNFVFYFRTGIDPALGITTANTYTVSGVHNGTTATNQIIPVWTNIPARTISWTGCTNGNTNIMTINGLSWVFIPVNAPQPRQ
jgi:hypothetical protein